MHFAASLYSVSVSLVRFLMTQFFMQRQDPWFNIKMPLYHYRKPHCGDKMAILSPQWDFPHWQDGIFILNREPGLPVFEAPHVCLNPDYCWVHRADSRLAPSQWETLLQSNTGSHWLGANLESALSTCSLTYLICEKEVMKYHRGVWLTVKSLI